MYRKLCFLSSFVLVLALSGSASAVEWTDDGADHSWCTPENWEGGILPYLNLESHAWEDCGENGKINIGGIANPVLISPGCDAEANQVFIGISVDTGPGVGLNMTGGTFTLLELVLGRCDGGFGWMTMSDGTMDLVDYSYLSIGTQGGTGRLDMTGGTINALGHTFMGSVQWESDEWAGAVMLPLNEGECEGNPSVGHLQLDGGIINCRMLVLGESGTMDITGGKMTIHDDPVMVNAYWPDDPCCGIDLVCIIEQWIADGNLTAYGGSGVVGIAYVETPDPCDPNEVWLAARLSAGSAWYPIPGNGATNIQKDVVLSWLPGDFVQATNGHHVYFGTSFADVNTRAQDANKGYVTEPNYNAGQLESLKIAETYYWAVDEVNSTHGSSPWPGPVWSFKMDRGVAKNPNPLDGADEVPIQNVVLRWTPGLEAADVNGSQVYLGTTWAEVNDANTSSGSNVYRGPTSDPCYPVPETFVLGEDYYWRIDTVNGPSFYRGDIWSFWTTGFAKNPKPEDGATDVPKNVILRWTRGTESLYHDVYFGSTNAEVTAATTTSDEYKTRTNKGTEEYDAEALVTVGEQYFWRIDEVNLITVKGYVWDFTVANYILVDDFDLYAHATALRVVWKDSLSGHSGDAEIWVNKDPNYAVDGNSMRLDYFNTGGPYYSEAMRSYSTAQDWSYAGNGVTLLEIDWFGDVNNVPDPPMYVKLSDGSTTAQVNPGPLGYGPNDVTDESLHTWNIPLKDFNDGGVTLSGITSIILGIGDGKGEGGPPAENGTLYFDDIRLYPPSCLLEYTSKTDFTEDCVVDNYDLEVMATDWLMADGDTLTETRDGTLTNFPTDDSQWITGHIGSGALDFDGVDDHVHVTDPRLNGITSMSITAWLSQTVDNKWSGIVTSREPTTADESAEIGIYGGAYKAPDGLGYDWPNMEGEPAWLFDAHLDVPEDGTWTFVALTVEPNSATLYMRPDGGVLGSGTNTEPHPALAFFEVYFDIGLSKPAGDEGYYKGGIDDVRIYAYNLSFADINDLAFQTGEPTPAPVYWYKFNETTGQVAADSGTPTLVYGPVQSKANLTDPEPELSRSVNLRDYAILAKDWLGEFEWPQP